MAFDGIAVRCLADELHTRLAGSRITKIAQPRPAAIQLTCKTREDTLRLLLSADASLPLAYLTGTSLAAPQTAPAFCMLLRKNLTNGRILSVSVRGLERVIVIDVEHANELGDLTLRRLYLELMGKHSNLILCDENDVILDAIKRVPFTVSSVREVLPQRPYFIPAQENRLDLLSASPDEAADAIRSKPFDLAKAVYTTFTGISPVSANELCFAAGLDGGRPAAALTAKEAAALLKELSALRDRILQKRWSPCLYLDPATNLPSEFAPFALSSCAHLACRPSDSMSAVLEEYYAAREAHNAMHQRSSDLRRHVHTLLDRNVKKLSLLQKQLEDTEKKDQYRLWGELLHVYGYAAEPGAKSLVCSDYNTGEDVTIPLDPDKSVMENAKGYFDRFGKMKRRAAALAPQIEEAEEQISQLQSVTLALDLAENVGDLDAVTRELAGLGFLKKHGTKEKHTQKSQPLHYRTPDGFDIYVGKNNEQNDQVTFRLAEPDDWWFHVKKIHGSHVIVKCAGKELPDAVFETAASLAAYYSQGRDSSRVEVDYIQRKFIKKPNKAAAGYVIYHTNYSMAARPSLGDAVLVR